MIFKINILLIDTQEKKQEATLCVEMTDNVVYSFWTTNPTILVCTLVLSIVLLFRLSKRMRPESDGSVLPPSPWRLPLIGNLHQLTAIPHQGLYTISQKLGPLILMYFGSIPYCVISSAKLAREVAKTHDAIFSDRQTTKGSRMLFSGGEDVAYSPENKFWKLTRKLCVSELLSPKRVQSFHYIRVEEVAKMITLLRSDHCSQSEIDLSSLFLELANSILLRAVLGLKNDKDSGDGLNDAKHRKLAIQGLDNLGAVFSFEDYIPSLGWLDHLTGLNKRMKTTCEAIHAFLDKVIDERETQLRNGNTNDQKCFVDIILELQDKNMIGIDLTRSNIRSILLDMFVAGIATSTSTMEWAMAELARNPVVMKKVQHEVRSVVGQKSEIQEHDIAQMEYLKCVIKETLRLHGITMAARQPVTPVTIGGFRIPAKVTAIISIWTIHRDPCAWDKPNEFIPERFINTSYNFKGQDEAYIPFGLGRRICPGVSFATSEIECALANILCWFDWKLPEGMKAGDLDMRESGSVDCHRISPLRLVPVPMPMPSPGSPA